MVPLSSGSGLQSCMLQSSLSTSQSLDWLLHCLILNLVPPPHEAVHSLHSDHSSVVLRFAAGQHISVLMCVSLWWIGMDWDLQTYIKYFCWNASIIEDVSFLLLGHKPH